MDKQAQLEWEARAGRQAALVALGALLLQVAGGVYLSFAATDRPDGDSTSERFRFIDREASDVLVAGGLQALGGLLLIPVLIYLYRVTKARRSELPGAALVLAVLGPALLAVVGVLRQAELVSLAADFTELAPDSQTEKTADDLVENSDNFKVIAGVGYGAGFAVGFALVLIALNAMRAGLFSRFMGIVGIIIGVLYALPVAGGPQIIQLFWIGALALLFADRWPGGRGPAWKSGEAIPWPSSAEMREEMIRRREERQREKAGEPEPEAQDAPAKRKRKRKK